MISAASTAISKHANVPPDAHALPSAAILNSSSGSVHFEHHSASRPACRPCQNNRVTAATVAEKKVVWSIRMVGCEQVSIEHVRVGEECHDQPHHSKTATHYPLVALIRQRREVKAAALSQ